MLPAAKSLEIMRILQEALTNVFKHSRASHVDVGVCYDKQGLRMTVHDNGTGFSAQANPAHRGTGMQSMRARVGRLGGTFEIQSAPGSTLITLHLPVSRVDHSSGPPVSDRRTDIARHS